ncbi:MAG TPA: hypothetical protein VG796_04445 [Verrucomicrobiales bacterium]|nr:hypothetical protein [Verrucomicrobiales bacterium]
MLFVEIIRAWKDVKWKRSNPQGEVVENKPKPDSSDGRKKARIENEKHLGNGKSLREGKKRRCSIKMRGDNCCPTRTETARRERNERPEARKTLYGVKQPTRFPQPVFGGGALFHKAGGDFALAGGAAGSRVALFCRLALSMVVCAMQHRATMEGAALIEMVVRWRQLQAPFFVLRVEVITEPGGVFSEFIVVPNETMEIDVAIRAQHSGGIQARFEFPNQWHRSRTTGGRYRRGGLHRLCGEGTVSSATSLGNHAVVQVALGPDPGFAIAHPALFTENHAVV